MDSEELLEKILSVVTPLPTQEDYDKKGYLFLQIQDEILRHYSEKYVSGNLQEHILAKQKLNKYHKKWEDLIPYKHNFMMKEGRNLKLVIDKDGEVKFERKPSYSMTFNRN